MGLSVDRLYVDYMGIVCMGWNCRGLVGSRVRLAEGRGVWGNGRGPAVRTVGDADGKGRYLMIRGKRGKIQSQQHNYMCIIRYSPSIRRVPKCTDSNCCGNAGKLQFGAVNSHNSANRPQIVPI